MTLTIGTSQSSLEPSSQRTGPTPTSLPITRALARRAATLSLNAKRRLLNTGLASWYPYYAGFPDSFARDVLQCIPLKKGAAILDPWNGSGTTTHIANQLGFRALGFDVNPVAALVSSAKLAHPRDAEHVIGLAQHITVTADSMPLVRNRKDPLTDWLSASDTAQYRAIEDGILANLATGRSRLPIVPRSGALPPLASFLLLALMRSAKAFASVRETTNPTWVTPGAAAAARSRRTLGRRWLAMVETMAADLSFDDVAATQTCSETHVADARDLPLESSSADFALTSPPYCTRIDYVVSASFELAAMGIGRGSPEFQSLRRACMGTPLAREGLPHNPCETWPEEIQRLLQTIRTHPSKASRSYYYKTYWQYFSDCEMALKELYRTLGPEGAAVIVVQNSYYKNVLVDLPLLYVKLGEAVGFRGTIINKVEARRALAQINSRSRQHRAETTYYESVIALEKTR